MSETSFNHSYTRSWLVKYNILRWYTGFCYYNSATLLTMKQLISQIYINRKNSNIEYIIITISLKILRWVVYLYLLAKYKNILDMHIKLFIV